MELLKALVIIFATSSGLICVYSLVSSLLLYMSVVKLSEGEDFAKLVRSLYFAVLIGFVYALWNLIVQLGLVKMDNEVAVSLISNLIIGFFFVMLAYLAFLTRQLSAKFGFRNVGKDITQYLDSVKKTKLKAAKKKRISK